MKIGILTHHFGTSYGGVLQCYALQQKLKEEGHKVEIINYEISPVSLIKRLRKKIKSLESIRQIKEYIISLYNNIGSGNIDSSFCESRLHKFDDFRQNYLQLTRKLNKMLIGEYANNNFDAIYVGSDQVWTDLYDKDLVYFLNWTPEYKGIRIAYAACSAHDHLLRESQREIIRSSLSKFNKITVRDSTTSDLVYSMIGSKPDIINDPSELIDYKEFYSDIKYSKPYILTYILGDEIKGGHRDAISRIKNIIGDLPILSIAISNKGYLNGIAEETRFDASPIEWLNLIRNASFIYTDSYHAILFAVKFNKPYVGFYNNHIRSSRLIDLRDRRGFKNIVNVSDDISLLQISL